MTPRGIGSFILGAGLSALLLFVLTKLGWE